jgi:hypothetical protein
MVSDICMLLALAAITVLAALAALAALRAEERAEEAVRLLRQMRRVTNGDRSTIYAPGRYKARMDNTRIYLREKGRHSE